MAANGHDPSRLDRLEAVVEALVNRHVEFEQELRQLLTAQVVLTDRLDRLTSRVDRIAEKVDRIAESQLETNEKLNALISNMDEFIRNRPR